MKKTKLMKWYAYMTAALSIVFILQGDWLSAVFNSVIALLIFVLAMSFEQTDFWIERWRQAAKDLEAVDKCLMDLEKLLNETSTPEKTDTNNLKSKDNEKIK